MFEQRLLENVKEGEEVLALVRRTPLVVVAPTLLVAVLIIAPFFFLYPLLKLGFFGVLVVILSVLVGVFLGLRTLWVHQLNAFILTATRIVDVDQRGFFHRVVSETTFDKVQDVSYIIKGIAATIFRYGSVVVQTAGTAANLELNGARNPQRVQELILKLQRDATSGKPEDQLSADELLAMIQKIKSGIGEEQFRRLIANRPRKQV
ncbi:MAG: PH domain-containing protein [bacterium]|nr:PH domain-containing protein [bacterium]